MTLNSAQVINPELLTQFSDSTLGLYLDEVAPTICAMGTVRQLQPGEAFAATNPLALHVLLDGRLLDGREWYGPGNHFSGAVEGMPALENPATVWTLDLSAPEWVSTSNRATRRALTHALIAADAAETAAIAPADLPDPATLCDVDHPEIRRRAIRLRRATPASTAEAIMRFVQAMPYRFGTWQERASETLARGIGMCTTKANLQVALMRASGLEAGFVEIPMQIAVLGQLMPRAWRPLMRSQVKHYFAAVKLDGRWHAADASYTDDAMRVYGQEFPIAFSFIPATLAEGKPYSPCHGHAGTDPFEIEVHHEINEIMGKKSRFLPRHFEALNVRLDMAQGSHRHWGRVAQEQLERESGARA